MLQKFVKGQVYRYHDENKKKGGPLEPNDLTPRPVLIVQAADTPYANLCITCVSLSLSGDKPGISLPSNIFWNDNSVPKIRPYEITRVPVKYIGEYIGYIPKELMDEVDQGIDYHLGRTTELPKYLQDWKIHQGVEVIKKIFKPTNKPKTNDAVDTAKAYEFATKLSDYDKTGFIMRNDDSNHVKYPQLSIPEIRIIRGYLMSLTLKYRVQTFRGLGKDEIRDILICIKDDLCEAKIKDLPIQYKSLIRSVPHRVLYDAISLFKECKFEDIYRWRLIAKGLDPDKVDRFAGTSTTQDQTSTQTK